MINETDLGLINERLEDLNYGICSNCNVVLPIGRGENFIFVEKDGSWVCSEGCKYSK